MKIIFIVTGGRNGSIFFQSLLDNHEEILQMPGVFYIDKFIEEIKKDLSEDLLADKFINLFPEFFDSRKDIIHKMDKLGDSKEAFFSVSKEKFKEQFKNLNYQSNKKDIAHIVEKIHLAYFFANSNIKKSNHKIISIHIHNSNNLEKIFKYFDNYDVQTLFIERDIIPSFASELNGWSKYYESVKSKNIHTIDTYIKYSTSLKRKLYEPYLVQSIDNNCLTVKLEDIHLNTKSLFENLSKKFDIKFSNSFCESTFNGLLWWGDAISNKDFNGINKNFKNKIDKNTFYSWELNLLKDLVSIRSKKYGYSFSTSKFPMRFLIFLPSKFEIKFLKKAINIFMEADLKNKIEIIKRLKLIFKSLFIKFELFVFYNQKDSLPTLFQK